MFTLQRERERGVGGEIIDVNNWFCGAITLITTLGLHSRSLGDMIHGRRFKTFSTPLFDDIRIKQTSPKRIRIFLTFQTDFKGLVCGYSKGTGTGLLREQKMYYSGARMVAITIYSSQREIKAVVRSYTLTHNEELNCIYLNKLCAILLFIVSWCIVNEETIISSMF